MRYKNSDDNRYRVQFMISTEELMDQLTVKEFISYLEENADFEDYTVEYIDKKCVNCRAYDLKEADSNLHKEFLVTEDGRVFYWRSLISKIELVDAEEEKQEVSKMVIKRLKGAKFGTDRIARVVTGYGGCHKYSYDITLSTSYGGTHGSLLEKDLCKENTRVYRVGITVL